MLSLWQLQNIFYTRNSTILGDCFQRMKYSYFDFLFIVSRPLTDIFSFCFVCGSEVLQDTWQKLGLVFPNCVRIAFSFVLNKKKYQIFFVLIRVNKDCSYFFFLLEKKKFEHVQNLSLIFFFFFFRFFAFFYPFFVQIAGCLVTSTLPSGVSKIDRCLDREKKESVAIDRGVK